MKMVYQYLTSPCPQSKKICDWAKNVECTLAGGDSPGTSPVVGQPGPSVPQVTPPTTQPPPPPVDIGTAPAAGQLSG